jgi:hypothetical protein
LNNAESISRVRQQITAFTNNLATSPGTP